VAAVVTSALLSLVALFGVGSAISVFTGRHAGRSGLRMAAIGALVATATFLIGKLVGVGVS
jgi:VIT1/CCC1 family predicted Fe2+/Mn2+ transporter